MHLKKILGVLSLLSVVLSVTLLAGAVSAADPSTAIPGSGTFTNEARHPGHAWNSTQSQQQLQTMITRLGQQGADISGPQADLAAGNLTAAMQWLHSYRSAHPGSMVNSTQQQERLQAFITHAEQTGVDVSQLKIALQNNDTAAVKAWMTSYMQAHKSQVTGSTQQQQKAQAFSSHPKTGIRNNSTAMKSWGTFNGKAPGNFMHTNRTAVKGTSS
jgi:hypothetical protein